jgi:hypothetical protein
MNPIYQAIIVWLTIAASVMLMVRFKGFTEDDVKQDGEVRQ